MAVTRDVTWRPTRRPPRRLKIRARLAILALLLGANVAMVLYHGDPREQLEAKPSQTDANHNNGSEEQTSAVVEKPAASVRSADALAAQLDPGLRPAEFGVDAAWRPTAGMRSPALVQRVEVSTLASGQTAADALVQTGADADAVAAALTSLQGIVDFRALRPGNIVKARFNRADQLVSVGVWPSLTERARADRKGDSWEAGTVKVTVDTVLSHVSGRVASSLWDALIGHGEKPKLVAEIVDIFGWDIDFYRDIHPGDDFRLLVNKQYVDGAFVGYEDVLAAEFTCGGILHRAFRFAREDGGVAYYDEKGRSMRKQLLKSPLEYGRVTSSYGIRKHPILGYSRAHNGVDYGVPTGTPVWSVGDGTVIRAGWGNGYGKIVEVRHANNWISQYAHLSRILVRTGQHVTQKEVIGKVGSTGLSTGPHLHYGLKREGRYVNPAKQKFERGRPLVGADLARYRTEVAVLRQELDRIRLAGTDPMAEPHG